MAKKKPAPKRGASRYQAPAKKPVPGWIWMICGLAIGGFIVFLMLLEPGKSSIKREVAKPNTTTPAPRSGQVVNNTPSSKPKYDFYTTLTEAKVEVPPSAQVQPQAVQPRTPEQDAARAQALLNGQEPPALPPATQPTAPATPAPTQASANPTLITPPAKPDTKPEAKPEAPKPEPAKASTKYYLQAGAFRNQSDADRVRAQAILLGQSALVETSKSSDATWHRVLLGPFSSKEQQLRAQKELSGNGFKQLIPQQR